MKSSFASVSTVCDVAGGMDKLRPSRHSLRKRLSYPSKPAFSQASARLALFFLTGMHKIPLYCFLYRSIGICEVFNVLTFPAFIAPTANPRPMHETDPVILAL